MVDKDALFQEIKEVLVSEFDIPEDEISLSSNLITDFDFDSIDAAELIVRFKDRLPANIDASMFRDIRTIDDLIEMLVKTGN